MAEPLVHQPQGPLPPVAATIASIGIWTKCYLTHLEEEQSKAIEHVDESFTHLAEAEHQFEDQRPYQHGHRRREASRGDDEDAELC